MRNLLEPQAALRQIDHETALQELAQANARIASLVKDRKEDAEKLKRSRAWTLFWMTSTAGLSWMVAGLIIYYGVTGK